MQIGYAVVESSLGWLLVAASERGLCSVMLGDSESELLGELQQKFHQVRIERDEQHLQPQVKVLLACLSGHPSPLNMPLDEQGTPFQLRVWQELRRIPRGTTISYSELAKRIGRPKAVRAVASACASNPLAIITPCHRVVRLNGDFGGYRWGIERKRRLLATEQE
jgi:AraC family transcriptional regulator, regulatory protein of adaptative response / methylated-DNA-[protein]-cysteine methyltransferase